MKYTGIIVVIIAAVLLFTGCKEAKHSASYKQISQQEAKQMMDSGNVIVLDVREKDEYDAGHIAGAVLLPVGTIGENSAAEVIPQKDSTVLVYCRSGNRSKTASQKLADLGYTQIFEFGGINTWPYEVEK
jgi:rhodanese-related sulfurtransferase